MTLTELHEPLQPLGVAAPIDLEAETAERHVRLAQQVAAVRRRSRLIHLLRRLLPGLIIALGVFNVGWIGIQTLINSLNVYGGNLDEIRYTNPRYYGQGDNGDRYVISGLEAVRKGMNATKISLKAPNMEFRSDDTERPTKVSAANGVFDQTTNKFTMTGHVVIEAGGSDFVLRTEKAIVDIDKSIVYGDKHVEGDGTAGHIVGESFLVMDKGRSIDVKGRGDTKAWALIKE
ncbi:MAG: LPS export ABC transporter periplasmic protein LptC [Asticcacaulis sp.]|uniref:LPS export ABC transporter periplasmic protein LptC n=1 Tax=Asticcacaulis sp. TaxID=1872648 RepID=UPI0039E6C8B0